VDWLVALRSEVALLVRGNGLRRPSLDGPTIFLRFPGGRSSPAITAPAAKINDDHRNAVV
jgi:hypothetical protein